MSKLKLLSLVFTLSAFTIVKAGPSIIEFKHEGGGFFSIFTAEDLVTGDYGVSYTPRLNFPLSDVTSISADMPMALGVNFAVSSQTGGDGVFSFQLPVKGTFNYGLGANSDDSFGFFAGGGLGMGYFVFSDLWMYGSGFGTGLYTDAGLRMNLDERGIWSFAANALLGKDLNIFGLRASIMFN